MRRFLPFFGLVVLGLTMVYCGRSSQPEPTPLESEPGVQSTVTPELAGQATPEPAALALAPGACVGLQHVYHPQRLQVLNPCVQAAGVVRSVKAEPDGDLHIRIAPAPASLKYLNAQNQGLLVLEPVCTHQISQSDAVSACLGYHNPQTMPKVGQSVIAVGPWVLDLNHGWRELHPATFV